MLYARQNPYTTKPAGFSFLPPEPTPFSQLKIPYSFLNCKPVFQCFSAAASSSRQLIFSSGFSEKFSGETQSPACEIHSKSCLCNRAFYFFLSSSDSLIPTSRKPLMIIPTASSFGKPSCHQVFHLVFSNFSNGCLMSKLYVVHICPV